MGTNQDRIGAREKLRDRVALALDYHPRIDPMSPRGAPRTSMFKRGSMRRPPDFLSPVGFFEILRECERRGWDYDIDTVTVALWRRDTLTRLASVPFEGSTDIPRALAEAFCNAHDSEN